MRIRRPGRPRTRVATGLLHLARNCGDRAGARWTGAAGNKTVSQGRETQGVLAASELVLVFVEPGRDTDYTQASTLIHRRNTARRCADLIARPPLIAKLEALGLRRAITSMAGKPFSKRIPPAITIIIVYAKS